MTDHTEDFREDMNRFRRLFTEPEASKARARRRERLLMIGLGILAGVLACVALWIGLIGLR